MLDAVERDEQERLLLDAIDRFLERDVKPYVMELEHNDIYPEEIVGKMQELGLFGSVIQEEYGGLGLSCLTYAKIVERVSKVWMSLSGIFNSHLIMASAVQRAGTEEKRNANGCRNSPAATSAASTGCR